jgi:hypothetical protein
MEELDRAAVRVAVQMQPLRDESGSEQFKAALPMGVLFEKSLDREQMKRERAALEENYRALVTTLRRLRTGLGSGDLFAYWNIGDAIAQFHAERAGQILFVENLNRHLQRDVPLSAGRLWVCEMFRRKFPDRSQIDPRQSITNYQRANFDAARLAPRTRQR